MSLRFHVLLGLAVAVFTANLSQSSDAAEPDTKKVRTLLKTEFDPDAERLKLFEGIDRGSLESWLIPQNEKFGHVFVENKADKPLTVEIPASVVAVRNLKQFLNNNNNNIFGAQNQNQQSQGTAGMQNVGGGLQGANNNQQNNQFPFMNNNRPGLNNNNNNNNNPFFFSIPPQSRVRLDFHSVCLNHGLKTPSQRHRYSLVSTDKYTDDEKLKELLALVGTGKIDPEVSQAVAWHLTDDMTYEQLAAKQQYHLGGYATSYFQTAELQQAVKFFEFVEERLAERKKAEQSESTVADSRYDSSQK